jgi:glycerophosphoryl diester phosphodiesterase
VISNYGNPGSTNDTWDEVGVDAILDYFFSVWFERDGDPYPPLLVSEFQPNTPGIDTDEEWVEFFNNAPVLLDLTNYKLGDEETIDGIEGMYNFPSGSTISPGKAQVVAQKGTGFNALFGFLPEYELTETSAAGNMPIDTLWASGTVALANTGDEILLLDSHDTILDVAVYGPTNTYPGVIAIPFVDNEQSVERRPVWHDTNDCSVDFRRQVDPSPGVVYLYGFFLPLTIKP